MLDNNQIEEHCNTIATAAVLNDPKKAIPAAFALLKNALQNLNDIAWALREKEERDRNRGA